MKGGEVATCPTFHMGRVVTDSCQCHSDRQLIEKKKLGFWVLVTGVRRRKNEQNGKKRKEVEEGKHR